MSQKEKVFSRKQLLVIFKIAFLEAMALSLIIPTISSTGEIPQCNQSFNGGCAPHIGFDSATSKSTIAGAINQTISVTAQPGDLLVVSTGNYVAHTNGTNAIFITTSVTDNFGDNFTRQTRIIDVDPGDQINTDNEIWTGFIQVANVIVTVKTNATIGFGSNTAQLLDAIGAYRNVLQVGSSNTTTYAPSFPPNPLLNVTTTGSSSWIVGSTIINDVPPTIFAAPNFIQRTITTGSGGNGLDLQDTNSTILNTNTKVTFNPTFGSGCCSIAQSAIEISPTFIDQSKECTPASASTCTASNVCTSSNSLCITTQYKLNFAPKTSGINTAQVLLPSTTYCTGITTSALVTTGANPIQGWGGYAGASLNITGIKILIQFKIGDTTPSTSFGVGSCAGGTSQVIATASMNFTSSGTLNPLHTFSTAITGFCSSSVAPCSSSGTRYGWFDISLQNFTGHVSFDQVVSVVADGISTISIMEIK